MANPKFDARLRARNIILSNHLAALGSALVLAAIGCNAPGGDGSHVELHAALAAPANPTNPAAVTKAATVTRPPAAAAAKPTVWVILKSQTNPGTAAKGKDWKGKGQAVYNALTTNAASSQGSLKS